MFLVTHEVLAHVSTTDTDFLEDFRKQEGKSVQCSPVSQGDTQETDKAEQPIPSLLRILQVLHHLKGSYINGDICHGPGKDEQTLPRCQLLANELIILERTHGQKHNKTFYIEFK